MTSLFYGDKNKWFIGIVKKISPDRSKVKVRIFGIHRMDDYVRLSNEDLPWAIVSYPVTTSGASSGQMSHDLQPETWVVGFFADGNECRYPIVTGVLGGGIESQSYYSPRDYGITEGIPDSSIPPVTGEEPSAIPGGSNPEKAYNFFREKLENSGIPGDPHIVASTIVGFLQVESGQNLDPTILNTAGSSAYGVAQWLGSRRSNLFRRFGYPDPGRSAFARSGNFTNGPTFEQQLQFIWEEFDSSDGMGAWNHLSSANSFREAGIGMIRYERNEAWSRVGGSRRHTVNTNHQVFRRGIRNSERIAGALKDRYQTSHPTPSFEISESSGI